MSQPTDTFYCDPNKKNEPENALVISALEYEPTVPIKYMVGTYCGSIFQFNRKSRTPAEAHHFRIQGCIGPVLAIERSKANTKVRYQRFSIFLKLLCKSFCHIGSLIHFKLEKGGSLVLIRCIQAIAFNSSRMFPNDFLFTSPATDS